MLAPMIRPFAFVGALLCGLAAPSTGRAQEAGASPWADSPRSRARLISGGPQPAGAYAAGVEIALSGKALTYWRTPGDAGVPPTFDFSASVNLAEAEVAYPAPERHDEGGAQAFGWRVGVVFPLRVRARDPARPVTLDLTLRYAACETICIPAEGRMRLTLAPGDGAGPHAARIASWRERVPRGSTAAGVSFEAVPIEGAAKPAWSVRVAPPPGPGADLFAEGPDGWFFDTAPAGDRFEVRLAERPAGATGPVAVRLTLTSATGAVEHDAKLDVSPGAH